MNLIHDWVNVLKRAWSIRLAIGAALLSGVDIYMQAFTAVHPSLWLSGASAALGVAAAISRLVSQQNIVNPPSGT